MTLLKRNIVANFLGQGWAALMSLIFIPLYIKFLGIEAYGLIGFFAVMQATLQILDLGLSQTMNREMARYTVLPDKAAEARDLVRTLEIGYWIIGIAIGISVVAASPFIAKHWIKAGSLPTGTVQQAVAIMGLVVALQWPISLYGGGLLGSQRQILFNMVKIGISTLGSCGAVLILWLVSPTITAFFKWQIFVSAVFVTVITVLLWRSLPHAHRLARFDFGMVRYIWRFAAGMSGIALSAIILMQLDKLILSKILSLGMFGYYTLAGAVSNAIPTMLAGPVFTALFPRFSSLVALNDDTALTLLYHQGTQLMAVLVLPVAAVLAFFSHDILLLWTGSEQTAGTASPIVSILVIGMALNALMTLPYALQLSHGWTSIGLRINTFLIITLVPTIYYMATHYGAVGAATVWVVLNVIYMMISVPFTHRRLLRGEMWRWFIEDVGPPLGAALLAASMGRWLFASPMPFQTSIMSIFLVLLSALLAAAMVAPHIRAWLLIQLKTRILHV
jgi:O-antigen/teichoic acid export membrane protein